MHIVCTGSLLTELSKTLAAIVVNVSQHLRRRFSRISTTSCLKAFRSTILGLTEAFQIQTLVEIATVKLAAMACHLDDHRMDGWALGMSHRPRPCSEIAMILELNTPRP